MEENKKHVQVPNPIESKKKKGRLRPLDYLVYANIKRYMNKDTKEAFPSITTICNHVNASRPTVISAIERLSDHSLIEIRKRKNSSNVYRFPVLDDKFEMFTDEFLDNEKLTPDQKAFLIAFQSQTYKVGGEAICTKSDIEAMDDMHVSRTYYYKQKKSLIDTSIMSELKTNAVDKYGNNKIAKIVDLAKICQAVLFVNSRIDNHEDRIQQLEKHLAAALKENKELKKKLYPEAQSTFDF